MAVAVIAGLAVGIAFVLLFALVMNTVGTNPANFIGKYRHITLSVSGLKDSYSVGEPLNFTLNASGYGAHCVEDPEITIADSYHILIWNYQTVNLMGCRDPDLNYPHKITDSWSIGKRLVRPLYLNQSDTYALTVTYYGETITKQFNIHSSNSTATTPGVDTAGDNVNCENHSDPAAEPRVCLFGRVPDLMLNIADQKHFGEKGSFCAPDVCVDTVLIVPEKLIRVEKGSEIAFETVSFRQPEQIEVYLWKGENRPVSDGLQLTQSTDENSRFTVDLPNGDYVLQVDIQWMKGEYSEMSAVYYYKIRVS